MNYDVIALACEQLTSRDKLRLGQLLIQSARQEIEIQNPQRIPDIKIKKAPIIIVDEDKVDTITYVFERLSKLKPTKIKTLTNSIKSMLQYQGGISDNDVEIIIIELQKRKLINLTANNVTYK